MLPPAPRTCGDVVAGVVTKCLNARAKTKEAGINVCLMFVEIEQQEVVQVRRTELRIAAGHWPFSVQFSTMATQNLIFFCIKLYRWPIKISFWPAKPKALFLTLGEQLSTKSCSFLLSHTQWNPI